MTHKALVSIEYEMLLPYLFCRVKKVKLDWNCQIVLYHINRFVLNNEIKCSLQLKGIPSNVGDCISEMKCVRKGLVVCRCACLCVGQRHRVRDKRPVVAPD